MQQRDVPAIIVSPYMHLAQVLDHTDVSYVVSILGQSDKLDWPDVGSRRVLRLQFDDITYSSGKFIAPTREQIVELVEFGRNWNGAASILIHCRAGSSRSPGAAAIVAAAQSRADTSSLVRRIALSKAYFRPHLGMLALADSILAVTPGLVELVRSLPVPTRTDVWGPIRIPLVAPSDD